MKSLHQAQTTLPLSLSVLLSILLGVGPLTGCAVSWDGLAGAEDWYEPVEVDDTVEEDADSHEDEATEPEPAQEETDEDGDGVPWPEDCHDGDPAIFPEALESCDGLDNNCNGEVDDAADADGDGFDACVDCDDDDADTYPGAPDEGDCLSDNDEDDEDDEDDTLDQPLVTAAAGQWVAGHLAVDLLTGDPTTDAAISQVITSLSPPMADEMVVVLRVGDDSATGSFALQMGQGEPGSYDWTDGVAPPPTTCITQDMDFSCTAVDSLDLTLPMGDTLHLRAVELSGSLEDPSGALATGEAIAAVVLSDLPDISTPDGSLAGLMAERSLDLDLDNDGEADAWSVLLSFTPIAF